MVAFLIYKTIQKDKFSQLYHEAIDTYILHITHQLNGLNKPLLSV